MSNELVFPNSTSRQREISVKTAVKEAVKRLGVSKITVRDLRRTAASRLLDAGIDHITIASILGNTDLRMILRYAQSSKVKRKAVKLLEKQNRRTARRATARRKQREKNGICFARPDEQIARSFLIGKTIRKLISRSKQFAQSG